MVGEKISPSGTGAIFVDSPFPTKEGGGGVERGCITFKFPIGSDVFFYYFIIIIIIILLFIRGAHSKTIKTGLNCQHSRVNIQKV